MINLIFVLAYGETAEKSKLNYNNDDRFIVFIVFTARDNCNDDLQIYLADNSYDCCFFL